MPAVHEAAALRSYCAHLLQELAYQSERYGAGQRMRRQGLHPANLGMADDLPSRLAAEQLSTLAGMSQKVCLSLV